MQETPSNQLPEVPPPIQTAGPPKDDSYAFITAPVMKPKKSLLPTGGSKQSRIFIVVGGCLLLIIIGSIVFAVINGVTSGQKAEWLTLAQKQAELIRITDIGTDKAQVRSTKNLAATTKLSLISSQTSVNNLAKKNGAQINSKSLGLGKDSKTDTALTTAEQSNQFDQAFQTILKRELGEYQVLLKKLYDSTNSKSAKETLSGVYDNADLLVEQSKQ